MTIRPGRRATSLALARTVVLLGATGAALTLAACGGASPSATTSTPPPTHTATAAAPGSVQDTQSPAAPATPAAASTGNCGRGTVVSTASQLRAALTLARPGETIALSAGIYQGDFEATTSGTSSAPITLCGPRSAVLEGDGINSGYTFYLDHASWWRVENFTVEGGQKGVMTDYATHDLIYGLYVHGTGDEAIHLRSFSSYDTVSHNTIRDTGLLVAFYGEGIYVGSAHDNWCRYTGCQPDGSDYDTIIGNNIADTTAENIDIKEGTVGGVIEDNHFDGTGMVASAATSWVNVKGNDWTITGNSGIDSIDNGLSVHQVYPGWGIGNVFRDNQIVVNGPGYGIYVQSKHLDTVVACDNTVAGAQRGFSSISCSSA
jgi:Right handed beta helix region